MKRKRYLYHVTDPKNVDSILREGLLQSGGKKERHWAVYMSEKPLSWWQPGKKILKVDTKNLPGETTTFLPGSDEILYWGDIPPERIKVYEPNTVECIKMFVSNQYDWSKK